MELKCRRGKNTNVKEPGKIKKKRL